MVTEINWDDYVLQEMLVRYKQQQYFLREATAEAKGKYQQAEEVGIQRGWDRERGVATMQRTTECPDLEMLLVSLCLFKADGVTRVTEAELRGWPSTLQSVLHKEARRLNPWTTDGNETLEELKQLRTNLDKRIAKMESAKNGQAAAVPASTT